MTKRMRQQQVQETKSPKSKVSLLNVETHKTTVIKSQIQGHL